MIEVSFVIRLQIAVRHISVVDSNLCRPLTFEAGPCLEYMVALLSADCQNGRPEFEGACGLKFQKLELHDVFHKPYIDLTPAVC